MRVTRTVLATAIALATAAALNVPNGSLDSGLAPVSGPTAIYGAIAICGRTRCATVTL